MYITNIHILVEKGFIFNI